MNSQIKNDTTLSLEIKSDLAELAKVRQFCGEVFETLFPEIDRRNDDKFINLQLALNEAVANVMEHGYQFASDQAIACQANRIGSNLQFDIDHDGKAFAEPSEIAQIDHPLEGGMGLFLIQQCVDQVTYCQTVNGRQRIRLTVRVP